MKVRASEKLYDSAHSDEEAPQLVPIRKKRLARLYYSKLERYRTLAQLTASHIQMKKEGKEERAYYWKLMKKYRTRRCSHAGSWYSKNSQKLREKVTTLMNQALSQSNPQSKGKPVKALISPHAGIEYSGKTAAHAFSQIDPKNYDRVIILGPSHNTNLTYCALSTCEQYKTPIGDLAIDQELNKQLNATCVFKLMTLQVDEEEHSLELQLPFIAQVFSGRPDLRILPIMVGQLSESKQDYYGEILSSLLKDERTLLVMSSDFCHWGDNFDYYFLREKLDNGSNSVSSQIERLDREGIEKIVRMDTHGFIEYLKKTDNTICGCQPIIVGMQALKRLGECEGTLIKYAQSSKIIKDFKESSVSYAAIQFRQL